MKCKIKFKDISSYVDGACTKHKAGKLEQHLQSCQECAQSLEGLRLLKQSLSVLTPVQESPNFDFAFNQRLKEKTEENISVSLNKAMETALSGIRNAFAPKIPALVKIAASFILVIAVLVSGYNYYIYSNLPVIKTVNGEAKIYKPQTQEWLIAKSNMRLKENYRIKIAQGAIVDISSRGKYTSRLKQGADITIARLDVNRLNHFTKFDIKSGTLMVNTRKGFKGSNMLLVTPDCKAKVVGTAFAVDVRGVSTWLGVLEGVVKVTSQDKDVYVNAGQKTQVASGALPDVPTLLADNEWLVIQELYQLGEKPQVVLLISARENRVRELLRPAPLYILDSAPRTIPKEFENILKIINRAVEDNDVETHKIAIKRLQRLIEVHPNPKYNPQFLMFIGSYYYYVGDYKKAIDVFAAVVKKYPEYALSSLAQRAVAQIYQSNIRDKDKAESAIEKLLKNYPNSVDAKKFNK